MWAASLRQRRLGWAILVALVGSVVPCLGAEGQSGRIRLWDTMAPLQALPPTGGRSAWRAVSPRASSSLGGDLVVEVDGLSVAFASRLGKVAVSGNGAHSENTALITPIDISGARAVIASTTAAEHNGVVIVTAEFQAPGAKSLPVTFTFRDDRIVAVRAEGVTSGVRFAAPIDLAIVPSFVGDDLIYDPRDYPSAQTLHLPSEHFLLGLVSGENGMLVMTWQEVMPAVRLRLAEGGSRTGIEAIEFVGRKGVSLAVLEAPGIWHREKLGPSFFERDVAIEWRPPFPAVWLTQLYEDGVKTTFEFRQEKEEHWRGGIGSYTLPAWFSDGRAMLSLGKKIRPEGEAVIYVLERNWQTPEGVDTPIDIARRSLQGDVLIDLLDADGRPTWWPMRPDAALGGETCNVTDELKAIFEAGDEVEKRAFVIGGAEDMCFHLQVMFERNGRYETFAQDMVRFLAAQREAKPSLAEYLDEMRGIAQEMLSLYDSTREMLRDMDYARELEAKTIALADRKRPDNAQRMIELKQEWIGMGGAAEELSRREHSLARNLCQQAAYRAAVNPEAVPVAEEIRRRTRACLERPDSYEIWENY